ncbi:MAG: hypothetical protein CMJ52_09215 [Planctomycetaceae bacterium]|nr:hypothetical protein [Planctomycetaceae bacterium]
MPRSESEERISAGSGHGARADAVQRDGDGEVRGQKRRSLPGQTSAQMAGRAGWHQLSVCEIFIVKTGAECQMSSVGVPEGMR